MDMSDGKLIYVGKPEWKTWAPEENSILITL